MSFLLTHDGNEILKISDDYAPKVLACCLSLPVSSIAMLLNTAIAIGEARVVAKDEITYLIKFVC